MYIRPFILLLLIVSPSTFGHGDNDHHDIQNFLIGKYVLVGKRPDSDDTFIGTVELVQADNGIRGYRLISDVRTDISGVIVHPLCCEDVHSLRISFKVGNLPLQTTYLIGSDLDNYGRLSGFTYDPAKKNNWPGMEVLFIDHRQRNN